jgi:hypothetical protein
MLEAKYRNRVVGGARRGQRKHYSTARKKRLLGSSGTA